MIPVLRTDRLTLRGPEARDFPAFRDYFLSQRSIYTGGPHADSRQAWMLFAAELGHWDLHGFGMWTVVHGDTPIGLVGCWYPLGGYDGGWPEHELGWLLWDGYEGQGYAREATVAARAAAYGQFGWTTAVSYIAPANARSIALAERLGCIRDGAAVKPKPDTLVYRHPSPEALA